MCRLALVGAALIGLAVFMGRVGAAGPDSSRVTLLFTADTLGELVPCGCSRRGGGLARRASLVGHLRSECPRLLLVEAGNLARNPPQLDVVARSLQRIGYQAVGFGAADATLGPEYDRGLRKHGVTALDGSRTTLSSPFQRCVIHRFGGLAVALTATGPRASDVASTGRSPLMATLREAQRRADLTALLTDWPAEEARRLVHAAGAANRTLILTAGTTAERPAAGYQGPWVISARPLGETAVRVDVTLQPDGPLSVRSASLPIDERWKGDAIIDGWCGDYVRQMAARVKVVAGLPPGIGTAALATFDYVEQTPSGTTVHRVPDFLNAAQCGACHQEALSAWRTSAHARAYRTLQARNRLIPDCLPCHSETYRRLEARENPASGGSGVECSACHGPGLTHARTKGQPGTVYRGGEDAQTGALCRRCHTPAQSPRFNFREFLARIHH